MKTKVGTFLICGNRHQGYFLLDTDTFNNWGKKLDEAGEYFLTRAEAANYAQRCHDFKIGRRMKV